MMHNYHPERVGLQGDPDWNRCVKGYFWRPIGKKAENVISQLGKITCLIFLSGGSISNTFFNIEDIPLKKRFPEGHSNR